MINNNDFDYSVFAMGLYTIMHYIYMYHHYSNWFMGYDITFEGKGIITDQLYSHKALGCVGPIPINTTIDC